MSADNGYTVMPHPDGGWALAHYMGDSEATVRPEQTAFPTVVSAMAEYYSDNGYMGKYWSEYGLGVGIDASIALAKEKDEQGN